MPLDLPFQELAAVVLQKWIGRRFILDRFSWRPKVQNQKVTMAVKNTPKMDAFKHLAYRGVTYPRGSLIHNESLRVWIVSGAPVTRFWRSSTAATL